MAAPSSLESPSETNKKPYRSYEDRILALPKFKGWFNMDFYLYQGYYYSLLSLPGLMHLQEHFNARSSDVFIATFPKSGTTWLKALVFAIVNRRRYEKETHPLLTKISHDLIPNLELSILHKKQGTLPLDDIPSPRFFSTHIPYSSLPGSMIDANCKIIYLCRNPKDVLISLYHYQSKIIPKLRVEVDVGNVELDNFTIADAYDLFCKGICSVGPFWDHVLSYWKASLERPENIVFLKYEDIKKDPQFYVKKLAQFLGHPFTSQEEDGGEVQHIVELCSFESLSSLQVNNTRTSDLNISYDAYYRKGEVGDWKNHLNVDMANHLDQITEQKFADYELML